MPEFTSGGGNANNTKFAKGNKTRFCKEGWHFFVF
jgi:hypothetical protein